MRWSCRTALVIMSLALTELGWDLNLLAGRDGGHYGASAIALARPDGGREIGVAIGAPSPDTQRESGRLLGR